MEASHSRSAAETKFPEVENSKLKVTNLSWVTSWQTLKDHFRAAGVTARYTAIIKTPEGRNSGTAIAKFNSPAEAAEAISKLQNSVLDGRNISLELDNSPESMPTTRGARAQIAPEQLARRIYIGNMPYSTTSAQIQELCAKVGEVVNVSVLQDSLGRSKGCATVEFSSADSAKKAISTLHDTPLNGRLIFVREDKMA